MILYCFISHNSAILNDTSEINRIMSQLDYPHYKIFYGGINLGIDDDHVVHIECEDTYEGLPNKIYSVCKYIANNSIFKKYSHFCKVDCTAKFKKLLPVLDKDYYGYLCPETDPPEFRRTYHQGKCSKNSVWNHKKYEGQFVVYCAGGFCYVLSNKAINCIANNPNNNTQDIYEDLYVGQKLLQCGIIPEHLNTTPFFDAW